MYFSSRPTRLDFDSFHLLDEIVLGLGCSWITNYNSGIFLGLMMLKLFIL